MKFEIFVDADTLVKGPSSSNGVEASHRLFGLDHNRCVLCARCQQMTRIWRASKTCWPPGVRAAARSAFALAGVNPSTAHKKL